MGTWAPSLSGIRGRSAGSAASGPKLKTLDDGAKIKNAISEVVAAKNLQPEKQIQSPKYTRTSRYNETVRANNKRVIQGKPMKRLPRGSAAAKQWRKTNGKQSY